MSRRWSIASIALLITTLSFSAPAIAQCNWTGITEICGSVGIGTNAPANLLDIRSAPGTPSFLSLGSSDASHFMWMYNGALGDHEAIGWKTGDDLRFGTTSNITPFSPFSEKLRITSSGNVGIGTTTPIGLLDLRNNTGALMHVALADASRYLFFYGGAPGYGAGIGWNSGAELTFGTSTNISTTGYTVKMRITSAGDVGIGVAVPAAKLDVGGNVHATGSISADGALYAKYQDVAEWVPATMDMDAGTVVVLNRDRENEVMPSLTAYDIAVAGVVSEQPGLLLGQKGTSKEQIATTGRVKVKVDATSHPIHVGDLLVSGTKPGFAMASRPVNVNGIAMHRPGTVIGKALQPLEQGTGEILVLLSLQ